MIRTSMTPAESALFGILACLVLAVPCIYFVAVIGNLSPTLDPFLPALLLNLPSILLIGVAAGLAGDRLSVRAAVVGVAAPVGWIAGNLVAALAIWPVQPRLNDVWALALGVYLLLQIGLGVLTALALCAAARALGARGQLSPNADR